MGVFQTPALMYHSEQSNTGIHQQTYHTQWQYATEFTLIKPYIVDEKLASYNLPVVPEVHGLMNRILILINAMNLVLNYS